VSVIVVVCVVKRYEGETHTFLYRMQHLLAALNPAKPESEVRCVVVGWGGGGVVPQARGDDFRERIHADDIVGYNSGAIGDIREQWGRGRLFRGIKSEKLIDLIGNNSDRISLAQLYESLPSFMAQGFACRVVVGWDDVG